MNQQRPLLSARTAGKPCGEPAVVVAEILKHGQVTVSPGKVEIGQGIVTALAQIAADELDIDLARVQMVRASTAPAPTRASPRAASRSSSRAARCAMPARKFAGSFFSRRRNGWGSISMRSTSRTAPFPARAMSGPAIGNLPRKSRSIATRRRTRGRSPSRGARWPGIQFSGSTFRTRFWAGRDSSTIRRWRECCTAACCGRRTRANSELKEDGARAVAGLVAIVRDGNFAGVVSETEHGAEAALNALRKGATWSDGEPCPTKTIWLHF